jgi:hypothetical protein
MTNNLKVLRINHISENTEECARIAISPGMVNMVASRDIELMGRSLKQITVHFSDGDVISFNISGLELENLEEIVAGYSLD